MFIALFLILEGTVDIEIRGLPVGEIVSAEGSFGHSLRQISPSTGCKSPDKCESNAEPGVYRDGGDLQDLPAHGLFPFQDRRQRPWQCADPGISAVLHDKAGISAAGAGSDLSGQYAGSVLSKSGGKICAAAFLQCSDVL